MAVKVTISSNARQIARVHKKVRKQIPFALSKALNASALKAGADVRKGLSSRFTIRNKYVERGIRVGKFATKRKLVAEVGSTDPFMVTHETGGARLKKPGNTFYAIPTAAIRKGGKGRVTPSKFPARLLKRKGSFLTRAKSGAPMVAQRKGKKRYPISIWWIFVRKAHIRKRLGFEAQVDVSVQKNFDKSFAKAFEAALRTAR